MSAQRFTPEFKQESVRKTPNEGIQWQKLLLVWGSQRIAMYKWVKAVSPDRNEQQPQELLEAKSEILRLRSQMRRDEEERDESEPTQDAGLPYPAEMISACIASTG